MGMGISTCTNINAVRDGKVENSASSAEVLSKRDLDKPDERRRTRRTRRRGSARHNLSLNDGSPFIGGAAPPNANSRDGRYSAPCDVVFDNAILTH